MPMAHIECHDDNATIDNTELVVFRKANPDEARAQFWQRIVRDSEDGAVVEASISIEVECAPAAITVARARPAMCRPVDPNRPLKGSFWSSVDLVDEGLGVPRECEHHVLNRYRAVEYECNTLASPAFGDVFCKPRDHEEQPFVRRVLQSPEVQATSVSMGPPPDVDLEVKPRSLTSIFEASGDSRYTASVVVEASEALGSRLVKRDREGSGKAEEANGTDKMVVDHTKGDPSTDEAEDVKHEEEDDEEEQGSKRARTKVVGDEAKGSAG